MKMSKSQLINSASEDENHGTKKVKLQVMNACLTLQSCNHLCMYKPCVSKESVTEN